MGGRRCPHESLEHTPCACKGMLQAYLDSSTESSLAPAIQNFSAVQFSDGSTMSLLQILIDTIDAAAEVPEQFVQRSGLHSSASRVDIYAVALYLFAQLYIRQAQRADAMDVWPSSQPFGTSAAVTVSARFT